MNRAEGRGAQLVAKLGKDGSRPEVDPYVTRANRTALGGAGRGRVDCAHTNASRDYHSERPEPKNLKS